MQENFAKLDQGHLETLRKEGILILPDFISSKTIDLIKKETSPWLEKIGFNNRISSLVINSNQWIEHVGICSMTALKLALDEKFIVFLESYFENQVSLGSFSLQRKIFAEKGIRLHSDNGEGLAVFLYLTDISAKTGATEFVKKSHNLKIEDSYLLDNKIEDAIYIDIEKSPFKSIPLEKSAGKRGTLVIFHRGIWHKLPEFKKSGREIIMLDYFEKGYPSKDHLVKSSFLNNLSKKQKEVYLGNASISSSPSLVELGNTKRDLGVYQIPLWKMLAYFIKYKLFSKV